jgi:hypothetical protein
MSKSETPERNVSHDRRMQRTGEPRRTRRERHSGRSDATFERTNDATHAASITLSAALPLDYRAAASYSPAIDRSISIAAGR